MERKYDGDKRLILHLGLPKTGTTTLQRDVFPTLPEYIGQFSDGGFELGASAAMFEGEMRQPDSRIAELAAWVRALEASDQRNFLVCYEGLSKWWSSSHARWPIQNDSTSQPRSGPHPSIHLVKQLRSLMPSSFKLGTVLVLRNQCDWLSSMAVQAGIHDGQFVQRIVANRDPFLDYYRWVTDLEGTVGPGNHRTLLFEHGLDSIGVSCAEFVESTGYTKPIDELLHQPANVRRVSPTEWAVTRPYPTDSSKVVAAAQRLLESRESSWGARVARLAYLKSMRIFFVPRHGTFSLTAEERDAIRECYADSVQSLSSHLGVELGALGY